MTMTTLLRTVAAIVAALVTALILLIAVELFSSIVHPVPPDFQGTQEEMCGHVERYPHWVLAAAVPMWAFTAFISTWLAGWLGNRASAILIAILLVAAVLFNVSMLPYTPWFKIGMPIVIVISVVCGVIAARRRPAATTAPPAP